MSRLRTLPACLQATSLSCTRLFMTPRAAACQAPLSVGFSRQESWAGLPFPPPGDPPHPGIEPESPALWMDSCTAGGVLHPRSHPGGRGIPGLPGASRREPSWWCCFRRQWQVRVPRTSWSPVIHQKDSELSKAVTFGVMASPRKGQRLKAAWADTGGRAQENAGQEASTVLSWSWDGAPLGTHAPLSLGFPSQEEWVAISSSRGSYRPRH